jgi:hypothetical protein
MNLFQNALVFDPQNVSMLVLLIAAVAWFIMLITLLVDLFSNSRLPKIWKVFWFPFLVGLPVVGGLCYGTFSLIRSLLNNKGVS